VTAGLLIDVPGTLDRYAFSHSLFRQTVYSDLPKARRTTLHRRLAEALERRHGSDPRHVAELARHFSGAGPRSAPKALEYCVHAGAAALGAFSYEEAIEHYSQALVAIEMAASDDESLRCEVLLALGEAEWRAGHGEHSRETFARASRIARGIGDASALGRAALGFCADGWERFGAPDQDAEQMLAAALEAAPEDAALRAKLTGRLAQVACTEQPQRGEQLGREAVSVARGSGEQSALAVALIGYWYALQRPDALEERRRVVGELLEVCEALRNRDLSLQAQTLRARNAAETGEIDELGAAITEHAKLADQIKQPGQQLHSRAYRANRALIRGRFDEVEQLAAEVIELGMLAQSPGALHYSAVELIVLRWEQGRMDEVEQALREIYERTETPMWRAALAVLAVEIGDLPRAQAELAAMVDGNGMSMPFDANWLAGATFLALACVETGDVERAPVLYRALQPYRGRIAVAGAGAACIGPVSHVLGLLAAVAGDRDAAIELLEEAAAQSRAAGSQPWLARANLRLGTLLAELGGDADATRSQQLLHEAHTTAERLGLGRLLRLERSSPAKTRA
jgi:tetratricopeptide (TPR) repeat protein